MIVQEDAVAGADAPSDPNTVAVNAVPSLEKVKFDTLNLDALVQRGVDALGFEFCSPIQGRILPHTLNGNDAIGKAQTGTGKTAAFLITIFNDLLSHPIEGERYLGEPRAVIIAPTRELVMQIASDAEELGRFTGLKTVTLIGGADYQKQLGKVNRSPVDIVVATPGRLIDFMERRDLALDRVEILVLDEADRMLDMGFIPQVKRIVRATPRKEDRQTLLFSATFTQDIMNLARQWTFEPITVEIEPERVATASVDQRVYLVASRDRFPVLMNLLNDPAVESVIIFANRRDQVRRLYEKLRKEGVQCGMLSGEITQAKRTKTLENFKSGRSKILVRLTWRGGASTSRAFLTWSITTCLRTLKITSIESAEQAGLGRRGCRSALPAKMTLFCCRISRRFSAIRWPAWRRRSST